MKYLKSYNKLNESEDFTDRYRTNGYMMMPGDESKVRKMFSSLLSKIDDFDNGQLLGDLAEKMDNGGSGQTDPIGHSAPWWIGDGEEFRGFEYDGGDWYINYMKDEYDEESDDYITYSASMIVDNLGINSMCAMMDFLMADHRVIDMLNMGALRTINNSPIKENFTDQFKSDDKIRDMFNSLLTTIEKKDYKLFKELEDTFKGFKDGDVFQVGDWSFFAGFSYPFGGDHWYIDYSEVDDDGFVAREETESTKTFDIGVLKDMINEIMSDYRVVELLNMDAFRLINRPSVKKFNELFDYKTDLNIVVDTDEEFKIEFNINNKLYFFQARQENLMFPESIRFGWHLGFGKGYGEDKYLPTKEGIPFKVLSVVRQGLDMFMDKHNPDKLSFISEGDTKTSIYLKMFSKYQYNIDKTNSGLDSLTGEIPYLYKLTR